MHADCRIIQSVLLTDRKMASRKRVAPPGASKHIFMTASREQDGSVEDEELLCSVSFSLQSACLHRGAEARNANSKAVSLRRQISNHLILGLIETKIS